ncbi:N-acyl-D-glutamate deacylase [Myxococcaceae bacterium]|jgi:N-acyl-D-aspartate/D-glutamate deacylase|nr:N-acyl-D-glutamate deacylase [Myxococcaceae bacterium]
MDCDWKLSGGLVIDGSGSKAFRADVALSGGRITDVGDLSALDSERVLDCSGRIVAPGFIDIHSHADWILPSPRHGALVEPFVRQGVTTVVTGNCGFSPAPVSDVNRESAREASRLLHDGSLAPEWETMGAFLDDLEKAGVALNVAQLVGHGSVRSAVTGTLEPRAPSPDELRSMGRLVDEALDAGCVGLSTGLGYAPGIFSGEEELTAFARMVSRRERLFTSHLKAYSWASGVYAHDPKEDPHNLAAIREILRVSQAAGARLQISHLIFVGRNTWPNHGDALRMIEEAHRAGLDVGFDAFPYTAGNTTCAVIFPAALLPKLEDVLRDPDQLAGLERFAEMAFAAVGFGLEDIQLMHCDVPEWNHLDGLRVPEAAARLGMRPFEFYARLTVASHRNARVLNHKYSGDRGEEEALRAVLSHPLCTMETDTLLTEVGHQNPASYGTFPRVLSTCVREGLFPLEEAVRRMTGAAADRLGWRDRGQVRPGQAADLVVFDPQQLRDRATFDEPSLFPEGIDDVFLNGRPILAKGRYDAAALAGTVIRS